MSPRTFPEILLLTRPLTPPWDEASKNLAYSLACNLSDFRFHILNGQNDLNLPKNITQHTIYQGSGWNSFIQKSKLITNITRILRQNPQIKIVHLLFAPTKLNSLLLKIILRRFPVKIIQSLACFYQNNPQKAQSLIIGDQIIVYSKYTANKIREILSPKKCSCASCSCQETKLNSDYDKFLRKKISVIPPFIDFTKFTVLNQEKRNELRAKWNISPNDKIIIYPGEYSRLNAMETLWEGYKDLISNSKFLISNKSVKLFITCRIKNKKDAILEKKFKKLVLASSYANSVRFITKLDNPVEMYQVADLTVFPVKSMEGKFDFPFVLLESLACGTPILTSNIAALPEIWTGNNEYKEKYVFATGNTAEYSTKMQKILSEKRGDNEKILSDYVKKTFNQKKVLEQYIDNYNR